MINTPTGGKEWNWNANTKNIASITKKEEIDILSIEWKENKSSENNKKITEHSHLSENELNFRKNIEKFLENIVGKNTFNLGKINDYLIFNEGWVMSVVAKIITENGKEYVFKSCSNFPEALENKIHTEAKALDIRRNIWIKTPKIYKSWIIDFNNREIPYIIMEYIKPTRKFTKENKQEIMYEIGTNIAKISQIKWEWLGRITKIEHTTPIGEYETMEEYYESFEKDSIKLFTENNIIGKKEKLHQAIDIVKNDFNKWQEASLNHEDPRLSNVLLTEPMTIFDPNLKLEHPLVDLAAVQLHILIDKSITENKEILIKNLREWYEEITKRKIDPNVFNACLVIRIISKISVRVKYPEKDILIKALKIMNQIQLTSTTQHE